MADTEAVDAEAAQAKKRLREDEESELAEENPEKKLRPLEEAERDLNETPGLDVVQEEKMEELAPEGSAEVEGRAKAKPEDVEAEPIKQEEVEKVPKEDEETEVTPKADEEAEAEVELLSETPVLPGEKASEQATEAKIGPKVFCSSMEMFNYFYELLRNWPLNLNLNKYEHLMLVDLIDHGHAEPERKKGAGIEAFQVRINPDFYSRCFYVVRTDGSAEDFSYRKCVDNILPLPEEFKARSGDLRLGDKKKGGGWGRHNDNRGRGGRGGGGRGGRRGGGPGRGNRGRGGRF